MRIEITDSSNAPMPVDIININSGQLTLLFPQNRSFVRLPAAESSTMPGKPLPVTGLQLQDTGQGTNILGFDCERYEIKQRSETMEIWATDRLQGFHSYARNQPHHPGPVRIEEQWQALLGDHKLFPLLASLRHDHGPERFRFEVKSVTPGKLTDEDAKLFEPPPDYLETQPLPF